MQELAKWLRGEACGGSNWNEKINKAADLIESQAAEIGKYKALCDQMGNALEYYQLGIEWGLICIPNGCLTKALEAWRELK